MTRNFIGQTPYDLGIELENKVYRDGKELSAITSIDEFSNITIVINESYNDIRGPVFIALTLLHEVLHAEIKRTLASYQSGEDVSSSEIWDNYLRELYQRDPSTAEHNFMIDRYTSQLGNAVYEYVQLNFPSEYKTIPKSRYISLAYLGLQGTETWKNHMSSEKRNQILSDAQYVISYGYSGCN